MNRERKDNRIEESLNAGVLQGSYYTENPKIFMRKCDIIRSLPQKAHSRL